MNIGIIGVGNIGSNLARHLVDAGHNVRVSNGKDPAELRRKLDGLADRVEAASIADVVRASDVVFLAVPWPQREAALRAAGDGAFSGKILVDATNAYTGRQSADGTPEVEDLGGRPATEVNAALAPGASVVKAFNTLAAPHLANNAKPSGAPDRIAVPVAGDHDGAKATVFGLVDEIGFEPVDAGSIADSRRQEPDQPLYNRDLTADRLKAEMAQPARERA